MSSFVCHFVFWVFGGLEFKGVEGLGRSAAFVLLDFYGMDFFGLL